MYVYFDASSACKVVGSKNTCERAYSVQVPSDPLLILHQAVVGWVSDEIDIFLTAEIHFELLLVYNSGSDEMLCVTITEKCQFRNIEYEFESE